MNGQASLLIDPAAPATIRADIQFPDSADASHVLHTVYELAKLMPAPHTEIVVHAAGVGAAFVDRLVDSLQIARGARPFAGKSVSVLQVTPVGRKLTLPPRATGVHVQDDTPPPPPANGYTDAAERYKRDPQFHAAVEHMRDRVDARGQLLPVRSPRAAGRHHVARMVGLRSRRGPRGVRIRLQHGGARGTDPRTLAGVLRRGAGDSGGVMPLPARDRRSPGRRQQTSPHSSCASTAAPEITIPTLGTGVTIGALYGKPRALVDLAATFPPDAPDVSDVTLTALCRLCHRPVTVSAEIDCVVNVPVYCTRPDCQALAHDLARQASEA